MGISDHAEQLALTVSTRTSVGGAATIGVTWVGEKTDAVLSMTGPEVLNACAIVGAVATVLGGMGSLYFGWRRNRREQVRHDLMVEQIKGQMAARDSVDPAEPVRDEA